MLTRVLQRLFSWNFRGKELVTGSDNRLKIFGWRKYNGRSLVIAGFGYNTNYIKLLWPKIHLMFCAPFSPASKSARLKKCSWVRTRNKGFHLACSKIRLSLLLRGPMFLVPAASWALCICGFFVEPSLSLSGTLGDTKG